MWRVEIPILLAGLGGCFYPGAGSGRFVCQSNDDCAAGYVCRLATGQGSYCCAAEDAACGSSVSGGDRDNVPGDGATGGDSATNPCHCSGAAVCNVDTGDCLTPTSGGCHAVDLGSRTGSFLFDTTATWQQGVSFVCGNFSLSQDQRAVLFFWATGTVAGTYEVLAQDPSGAPAVFILQVNPTGSACPFAGGDDGVCLLDGEGPLGTSGLQFIGDGTPGSVMTITAARADGQNGPMKLVISGP